MQRLPGCKPGSWRSTASRSASVVFGRGYGTPGSRSKKVLRAAEQDRSDIVEAREEWRASQPGLNPERLVFIDETWAKTNMARLIGRPPRGQRLIATVPHGHW